MGHWWGLKSWGWHCISGRSVWKTMQGSIEARLGLCPRYLGLSSGLIWGLTPAKESAPPLPYISWLLHHTLLLLPHRKREGPGPALCQVWKPLQPVAQCGWAGAGLGEPTAPNSGPGPAAADWWRGAGSHPPLLPGKPSTCLQPWLMVTQSPRSSFILTIVHWPVPGLDDTRLWAISRTGCICSSAPASHPCYTHTHTHTLSSESGKGDSNTLNLTPLVTNHAVCCEGSTITQNMNHNPGGAH
jgi:hypothetical protein